MSSERAFEYFRLAVELAIELAGIAVQYASGKPEEREALEDRANNAFVQLKVKIFALDDAIEAGNAAARAAADLKP